MDGSQYTELAIDRSKDDALEWLQGNTDGYPRSWKQEELHDTRRGYKMYQEDWEAPPIAGYEALEREGVANRLETVIRRGEERVHFRLAGEAPPIDGQSARDK